MFAQFCSHLYRPFWLPQSASLAPPFLKVSSVSSSRTCFILFDEFLGDIFSFMIHKFLSHSVDTGKGQGKRHQLGDICQNQRLFQTHQAKDKGNVPKDCSSPLTDLMPRFPLLFIPLVPSFPPLVSTIWFVSHFYCAELRGSNWN